MKCLYGTRMGSRAACSRPRHDDLFEAKANSTATTFCPQAVLEVEDVSLAYCSCAVISAYYVFLISVLFLTNIKL